MQKKYPKSCDINSGIGKNSNRKEISYFKLEGKICSNATSLDIICQEVYRHY